MIAKQILPTWDVSRLQHDRVQSVFYVTEGVCWSPQIEVNSCIPGWDLGTFQTSWCWCEMLRKSKGGATVRFTLSLSLPAATRDDSEAAQVTSPLRWWLIRQVLISWQNLHPSASSWRSVPAISGSRYSSLSSGDACSRLWCEGR